MLYEPTTLASVARLVGETLQKDYGIDPAPIFGQVKIDTGKFQRPGSRVPLSKMTRLWDTAVFVTDDQQFGLRVGTRAEPGDFYVLGHAWLASATLKGALERLCRYAHVLSTAITRAEVVEEDGMVVFVESFPDPEIVVNRTADEAGIVAFFKLCEIIRREPVRPIRAELIFPADTARDYLDEFLGCPVSYGNEREKLYFSKQATYPTYWTRPPGLPSSTWRRWTRARWLRKSGVCSCRCCLREKPTRIPLPAACTEARARCSAS